MGLCFVLSGRGPVSMTHNEQSSLPNHTANTVLVFQNLLLSPGNTLSHKHCWTRCNSAKNISLDIFFPYYGTFYEDQQKLWLTYNIYKFIKQSQIWRNYWLIKFKCMDVVIHTPSRGPLSSPLVQTCWTMIKVELCKLANKLRLSNPPTDKSPNTTVFLKRRQ